MNNKVNSILSLSILHNYFIDSICKVLTLIPNKKSNNIMQTFGLLGWQNENIYSLYSTTKAITTANWNSVSYSIPELYFFLVCDDNNFQNYTDLPLEISDKKIYYFTTVPGLSNVQKNSSVSNADQYTCYSTVFSIAVPALKQVLIQVTNSQNKIVVSVTIDGTKQNSYTVNLNNFGTGFYELSINGKLTEKFIAIGEKLPVGCIGLFRADFNAISKIQTPNTPFKCTLTYDARSTFWRYQVVQEPNNQMKIESMVLKETKVKAYAGPVQQKIAGGYNAWVFTSTDTKKLQEKSDTKQILIISYKSGNKSFTKEMKVTMPFPDVSVIQSEDSLIPTSNYISNKIVFI